MVAPFDGALKRYIVARNEASIVGSRWSCLPLRCSLSDDSGYRLLPDARAL